MALADALSFHQVFAEERVWIDLGFFVAFVTLHTIANWTSPALPSDDAARMASFSFVREIAGAGLTAAGILLPLSLAAVGTFAAETRPDEDVLTSVFIGDAWLTLSLVLGLIVLWIAGYRAHTENVQNRLSVRLAAGFQLAALAPGVVRLLTATFLLVDS